MPRLFLALPVPLPVRKSLETVAQGIPETEPVQINNFHLTLKFLGPVPEIEIDTIIESLQPAKGKPFYLEPEGISTLPAHGNPSVIIMNLIRIHPGLFQLRKWINDQLLRRRYEPDTRSFLPHITLARCQKGVTRTGPTQNWVKHNAKKGAPTFQVDRFTLFQSQWSTAGPNYLQLHDFFLK
ncbi:MAG: RNA 2',3'-cyclic phosphodiesterase [Verrucomicrobiota bacterium]